MLTGAKNNDIINTSKGVDDMKIIKASVLIVIVLITYITGFGHGQSSAYKKQTDDRVPPDAIISKERCIEN